MKKLTEEELQKIDEEISLLNPLYEELIKAENDSKSATKITSWLEFLKNYPNIYEHAKTLEERRVLQNKYGLSIKSGIGSIEKLKEFLYQERKDVEIKLSILYFKSGFRPMGAAYPEEP